MGTMYKIGDKFQATYTNAPVAPEARYPIGSHVSIRGQGVLLAIYQVEETDDTHIRGTIIEVFEPPAKRLRRDPRRTRPL